MTPDIHRCERCSTIYSPGSQGSCPACGRHPHLTDGCDHECDWCGSCLFPPEHGYLDLFRPVDATHWYRVARSSIQAGPMQIVFYDDPALVPGSAEQAIFLAGPTATVARTAWRIEAIALLERAGFTGKVIVPEFRVDAFVTAGPRRFAAPPPSAEITPGMRVVSHNILAWETAGIEHASTVLFWMPFAIAADPKDPASLPGFTTRAEVSREIVRDPRRVVLGMPSGAVSSSHIRYHAHRAGLTIHATLAATVAAAVRHASGER